MNPLETYLGRLREIRGRGVAETASYGTLEALLNEVGATLKPKVTCIINIRNRGAGIPDGGFFTQDQIRKERNEDAVITTAPARGVMEVKGVADDVRVIARGAQVAKYLAKYGQALVTNYREFILVVRDDHGQAVCLESFSLGDSEDAFWQACAHPRTTADAVGERLSEFLKRVMLRAAVLDDPEELAWFLASYARDALARVEASDLPALATVREGLEEALGIRFEGERGRRFFRSTFVQTLFYGVFSAWILWCDKTRGFRSLPGAQRRFSWKEAAWTLRAPMIRTLFEQTAQPSKLGPLGLDKLLDLVADTLNRVDRPSFFQKFNQEEAVQYFYEPFLEAFDPVLRKDMGVWYTPPEIVQYMVRRVDTVLKEELDIPDGLADERVYVLDPCCGTGAFLVGVLKVIQETLAAKGGDALSAHDLKRAAMERVFGFEILPAPFVIAHLQLGLLLQRSGAPLVDESNERAAVYLTNALTGWEPPSAPKARFLFPEMEEEKDAAEKVKRDTPILVILGNPPYNAFAGVGTTEEEQDLVRPYKDGLISRWGIKKFNLDDLYVRFFRLAERRIAERTGRGVVCFISNFSWTSEPSFVVLRKRLLDSFDKFWIENMHGNRKISEYAPDGRTSETIFAIPGFSSGIQQGVVISLWVKTGKKDRKAIVRYRDDLNQARANERRAELLESLKAKRFNAAYSKANPAADNRYSFKPLTANRKYQGWPRVTDLCAVPPSNGLMEKRGGALMDLDRAALETRMRAYFNPKLDWEEYKALGYGLTDSQGRFAPKEARKKAIAAEAFNPARLVRYAARPFETRWAYYTGVRPVWNEPRPSLWSQCWEDNRFFLARLRNSNPKEGHPFYFVSVLSDDHVLTPDASAFPLQLKNGHRLTKRNEQTLFDLMDGRKPDEETPAANLSQAARAYLKALNFPDPDKDAETAALIWMHALAIGYAPEYLSENADGVRQDWPRIPLPTDRAQLLASAALGRALAALLDTEAHVTGVTAGTFRPELKLVGRLAKAEGAPIDPNVDLRLTAGWGHAGKEGVTMPGKGKTVLRDYTPDERRALKEGCATLKLTEAEALACLGENAVDVYLNAEVCWSGVPQRVYDFTIGGYQVIKKWLSYREESILGRALTPDEARYVTEVIRRLAAIVLLQPTLDANYEAVKAETFPEESTLTAEKLEP